MERGGRGTPLFESIVVFENYPVDEALEQHEGSLRVAELRSAEQTHYPLTLVAKPGAKLQLGVMYARERFAAATVERLLANLAVVLEGIGREPDAKLGELPYLSEGERKQLVEWNETAVAYEKEELIHELFEAQVERTPEAVAVVWEGERVTYRELEARANKVAHQLQGRR